MKRKSPYRPVIFGCSGTKLTDSEKEFFKKANPLGYILFARNIENKEQLKELIFELRTLDTETAPLILIDQEGGRVQRLKPPVWRQAPPAARFGDMYGKDPAKARELCFINAQLIGAELAELGITVDCAPCLDVAVPGAHDVIGDRAFSKDPKTVSDLGKAFIDGLMSQGVLPVIKHMPGHGRATADSHDHLPEVKESFAALLKTDFVPFKALSGAPLGMTAHILYPGIDPQKPATLSKKLIEEVIRRDMGFNGLLMCDDLSMKALSGSLSELTEEALKAGCDAVLHCNGKMEEMEEVLKGCGDISENAVERFEIASQILDNLQKKVAPIVFDELAEKVNV